MTEYSDPPDWWHYYPLEHHTKTGKVTHLVGSPYDDKSLCGIPLSRLTEGMAEHTFACPDDCPDRDDWDHSGRHYRMCWTCYTLQ